MSGSGTNPLIPQGTLNRLRVHIVVPSFTGLNITPSNMSQSFASLSLDEATAEQIKTATGVINSPEPYIMGRITCGILRTQPLASAWLSQAQATTVLGPVTIHSDTSAFPAITLHQSIFTLDPGAYDGKEGILRLTVSGVYNLNNNLWFGI